MYTILFENYVHDYSAAHPNAANQNIYTEEVYWIPANVANFGNYIGLAGPAHQVAYLFDNVLWGQIRAAILAELAVLVGGFPTGLPPAAQAAFTPAWANLQAEAVPAAPVAGGRRRSYSGFVVRLSDLYAFLRLINQHPSVGGALTQWSRLRALCGRIRILDFTGESSGGQAAIADAKFSWNQGFDVWGPGQAADQLTVHQALANGPGAAASVPAITWHLCACNQQLLKDMIFDEKRRKLEKVSGARNESKKRIVIEGEYESKMKRSKFISSADVAYV